MAIVVKDFLVCDDVRLEHGNKHAVMGVYGDKIKINVDGPIQPGRLFRLSLSLFIRLLKKDSVQGEQVDFKIRIEFKGNVMGDISGGSNFADNTIIPLPIRSLDFELSESGDLKFIFTAIQKGQEVLNHVETINIELTDVTPPV